MKVRFRELEIKCQKERDNYLNEIEKVFKHGKFILGPEVELLENKIQVLTGRDFCVGVNSGTSALYTVLNYLKYTSVCKQKKYIVVPSITWVASVQTVIASGFEPLFIDTNNHYFLNTDQLSHLDKFLNEIAGVMAVDFTGYISPQYEVLIEWCEQHNILLIQDSAQAFGAETKTTKTNFKACGIGFASCLSINSMKLLSSHGEAGMICTDDQELSNFAKSFRTQGCNESRMPIMFGMNLRIETIQAAIILKNLEDLPDKIKQRQVIASEYSKSFSAIDEIETPITSCSPEIKHTYYTYQIKTQKRNKLFNYLIQAGIECQKQYDYILPDCEFLKSYKQLPMHNSSKLVHSSMCLPCHERMTADQTSFIIEAVNNFFALKD